MSPERRSSYIVSASATRDQRSVCRAPRAQQADAELLGLKNRLSFIEGLDLDQDPALVRTALAQAEERRKQVRLALREVELDQSHADDAFVAAETTLASLFPIRRSWL
jgi:hypothetical protein